MIVSLLYYESLKSGCKYCYDYLKRFMYEKKGIYKANKIKKELSTYKKIKKDLEEQSEEQNEEQSEEELYLE